MAATLLIRNAELPGHPRTDVRIADGRISEIAPNLTGASDALDARGGALIPGLADHHIHLMATAARRASVPLDDARTPAELNARLAAAIAARSPGAWIRAAGWHEHQHGPLTRARLDALAPTHPVRVQHQTGALWIVNSAALERLGPDRPAGVDAGTGQIWRQDAWLRERVGPAPPPLADLGAQLATYGVTHLTDATVTTDASAAALIAAARLPQRLMLMSGHTLPPSDAYAVGPLKIVPDERDLPSLDDLAARIADARAQRRAVAVHCVTAAELALTLAAFDAAGSAPGDRIEHGGVIDRGAIETLRRLRLTVVTQPGFIHARGDRFAAETPPAEHADLYRCASLLAAGVPVAASSDAPYGPLDPWVSIQAAVTRRTAAGAALAPAEAVAPHQALALWQGPRHAPGAAPRTVAPGQPADLCLLRLPLAEALATPTAANVAATIIAGAVAYLA